MPLQHLALALTSNLSPQTLKHISFWPLTSSVSGLIKSGWDLHWYVFKSSPGVFNMQARLSLQLWGSLGRTTGLP